MKSKIITSVRLSDSCHEHQKTIIFVSKTKMLLLLILTSKIIYAQDTIVKRGRTWQNNFSTEKRTHVFRLFKYILIVR